MAARDRFRMQFNRVFIKIKVNCGEIKRCEIAETYSAFSI